MAEGKREEKRKGKRGWRRGMEVKGWKNGREEREERNKGEKALYQFIGSFDQLTYYR